MRFVLANSLSNPPEMPLDSAIPDWITPALLAETARVWQPFYAEPLTAEDALAIVSNVAGLLDALEDTT